MGIKEIVLVVFAGVFIYLQLATIVADASIMGVYGLEFAKLNQLYFGYISYVYLFLFLAPIYFIAKKESDNIRKYEIAVASFLLFFALLLAQALSVTTTLRGKVGAEFVEFASLYIGEGGLWIFLVMLFVICYILLLQKNPIQQSRSALATLRSKLRERLDLRAEAKKAEAKSETSKKETKKELSIEPKSESASFEDEIDKPSYQRREVNISVVAKTSVEEKKQEIAEPALSPSLLATKESKNILIVDELEENAKLLSDIEKGEVEKPKNFKLPPADFLQRPAKKSQSIDEKEIDDKIKFLLEKLAHFKIEGDVVRTYAGPVVSTFEFKPAANVKVSRILNLQDDLAMALSAQTIRIQAPIPGKDVVGIEIPNESIETIYLRELIESDIFKEASSPLTIVLGKDIVGKSFVTDLKKLPHLLIAGTTGSGKSVGINAMILSLLYKNSPDNLRLLMIDPKMLEFSIYNDIPHLLTPVITKAKQAIVALNNMVGEMERRYALMSQTRTKNIENYNEKVKQEGGEHFPYIVVIIDELADLMMTSGKDVEFSIARLAQMARASGIHLVVATQRPSVDVVTGLIKANLPSRISYRVGQKVDSKIILDQLGAESLLGRGDLLFTPPGSTGLVRLHAPWSSESEIEKIVSFIKSQREPAYDKRFLLEESGDSSSGGSSGGFEELDPMFDEAKNVVLSDRKTSISYLQRKLQIGYNKAARLIEQLEAEGIVSEPNSKGIREIL